MYEPDRSLKAYIYIVKIEFTFIQLTLYMYYYLVKEI